MNYVAIKMQESHKNQKASLLLTFGLGLASCQGQVPDQPPLLWDLKAPRSMI